MSTLTSQVKHHKPERQSTGSFTYYAPPLIGGALSDAFVWRLSVAYIEPKSRTERPRKTKIGTEVAHVIRDSDTTFKIRRSKVKVNLLARQAAAAVGVRTCRPWETAATLPSARRRKALRRPRGMRGLGAYSLLSLT